MRQYTKRDLHNAVEAIRAGGYLDLRDVRISSDVRVWVGHGNKAEFRGNIPYEVFVNILAGITPEAVELAFTAFLDAGKAALRRELERKISELRALDDEGT